MVGGLSVIPVYLLQNVNYFKEDDPLAGIILVVGIGGVLFFLVIKGLIKNRKGASASRRFSRFALYRIAKSYGLDKAQSKVLEEVFKSDAVSEPNAVIQSAPLLDKHFKRAYHRIKNTEENDTLAQQQIALLFSTRNTIDAIQNTTATATSTREIPANMTAVLTVAKETYSVRVIDSKGAAVLVECPCNPLGTPQKIPNGTKVSLAFFSKSSKGYSFDSKIVGVQDTSRGPVLQIAHAAQVKALVQRRFRRRQTTATCAFSLVTVKEVKVGRKITRKMSLDDRRFSGTLLDISIGGCSLRSSANIQAGVRLKIDFEFADSPSFAVLGQVLRINRGGGLNTTIHIKFIKTPQKAQNSINALVFEYNEN
jgi:c-di-GMP-binding flagellar brake protein YcgR